MNVVIFDNTTKHPVEQQPPAITAAVEVDIVIALLAEVCARSQNMTEADKRRTRDFVRTTLSTLESKTSLPSLDQAMFETALQTAAARASS